MPSLEYEEGQLPVIYEGTGYFIPWQTIQALAKAVAEKMAAEEYVPSNILCVGRGGMIASRLLAEETTNIFFYGVKSYTIDNDQGAMNVLQDLPVETWQMLNDPSTLIVDDLWDTGATVSEVLAQIPLARVALLMSKKKPEETSSDFTGFFLETTDWIVFPWERSL